MTGWKSNIASVIKVDLVLRTKLLIQARRFIVNIIKLGMAAAAALTIAGCSSMQASIKDEYKFYLAGPGSDFSQPVGTLDRSGRLNITYKNETYTGQNANNVIEAKGSNGGKMRCAYKMPGDVATGTCTTSNGTVLNMKFD
ncbi:hypothetical protein [Dickeya zeae]|uniref:hypothetical protein n=1 Tax=Dickeya zeae TaxID=204042 RepID=UPI000575F31C|nr:hypothetical protein [Dickeya zeae]